MNLEKVSVNIRPRTAWEAIDLGFLLARQWYRTLWQLWMLTALPALTLVLIVGLILPGSTVKWALFFFWLFKSFYEPCLLLWVSMALFDERSTTRQTLRNLRKSWGRRWILDLLLLRFSPFRSFSLPVVQLEKLEGKKKRQRLRLLQDASEIAVLLTTSCFFLEIALTFSLLMTLFFLIPDQLRWINFGHFVFLPGKWLLLFCYVISCSIIAPFYVCSGFMMYISRRVQLEAWDIEIGFKRIGQRIKKLKTGTCRGITVLLVAFALTIPPSLSNAEVPNPQTAKEAITKVLKQKDFGQKVTVYRWVPKKKDAPKTKSPWAQFLIDLMELLGKVAANIVPFAARYGEILLWCFAGILIGLFLVKYAKIHHWMSRQFQLKRDDFHPPEVLFGLDLRPESLPADISAACLDLLKEEKKREALSLLYRGTLSRLVNQYRLEIHSSFTEQECCREVGKSRPEKESIFFNDLVSLWIFLAFGHREPETELCRNIVHRWASLYGGRS